MHRAAADPTAVRVAVGPPQVIEPSFAADPGATLAGYARVAEELGFDGLWTLDSVPGGSTGHMPILDALQTLTYAAAATTTIPLGVAVIVVPRRNPLVLAKELASIDQLSGGRLTAGLGIGGADDEGTAGLGFTTGRRGRRLSEAIAAMRAAWSDGSASHDGELLRFANLPAEPKPAQRPGIPLWLGGGSEPAQRRAAKLGDGWIGAGGTTIDGFVAQARTLEAALDAAGRDPADFPVSKRVYIEVDDDQARGRERLGAALDAMYNVSGFGARVGLAGSAEYCAEQIARLIAAGADHVLLSAVVDVVGQLDALAQVAALLKRG